MRYKVVDLRHILSDNELDILAISEAKLCDEFPDSQFVIKAITILHSLGRTELHMMED